MTEKNKTNGADHRLSGNAQPNPAPRDGDDPAPVDPGTPEKVYRRIKHPSPIWWPHTQPKQIELGRKVYNYITAVNFQLLFGVDNNTVVHVNGALTKIDAILIWLEADIELNRQYIAQKDELLNGAKDLEIKILKLDTNRLTTLGPAADTTVWGGLLGWLMELERLLKLSKTYVDNPAYGRAMGYIPDAVTVNPDTAHLIPNGVGEQEGGLVRLSKMTLPKQAKYTQIFADRDDGQGVVEVAVITGSKFTDHHTPPEKTKAWQYILQLLDADAQPIGQTRTLTIPVQPGLTIGH
jgi:hypothetical protein